MLYRLGADLVLLAHFLFAAFAVFGGVVVFFNFTWAWAHIPVVLWSSIVNLMSWTCPLTPLENALRVRAGQSGYSGGFAQHYVGRAVYPRGMPRRLELVAGVSILAGNALVYAAILAWDARSSSASLRSACGTCALSVEATYFLGAVAVGLGATLFMDLWAMFLKRAFGVPSPNYCLVGRWFRHMPEGTFMHVSIANASQKRFECAVGWIAHYVIGVVYALIFVALVSDRWLARPTVLPALLFGVVTVIAPFLVMHPSFGLGIAASGTPNPWQGRLRSLMAHAAFGVGLYVCAIGVRRLSA